MQPRSLFNAARAHSRLHQAAVLAASSIRVTQQDDSMRKAQTQLDSVLLYLDNHGQQVSSLEIQGFVGFELHLLPLGKLQGLSSLTISGVNVRLQRGFYGYRLMTGMEKLGTALSALPGLQHLSIDFPRGTSVPEGQLRLIDAVNSRRCYHFPSDGLQGLQQLTYLELVGFGLRAKDSMQQLQALTCLQDLRLDCCCTFTIDSSMLSGSQQLTRLELRAVDLTLNEVCCIVQPAVLAGKTRLRHLNLMNCAVASGGSAATKVAEMLAQLQQVQQLTFLSLRASFGDMA